MKHLITIFTILFFAFGTYAQIASVGGNENAVQKMLAKDYIEFSFPSEVTQERIDHSSKFYVNNFTVDYNKDSKIVKINFVETDEMSKKIVVRFLVSSGIKGVEFNKVIYSPMEFYDKVMKSEN